MYKNTLFFMVLFFAFTLVKAQGDGKSNEEVVDWSVDDFIVNCPENIKQNLKKDLSYEMNLWKTRSNSFVAHYSGNDFGDYHHINFTDENENVYDFGFGNNDFGTIQLFFKDKEFNDNPKYLKKKFKVFWKWKVSSFPCCGGDYKMVKAYMPSITKLELLD